MALKVTTWLLRKTALHPPAPTHPMLGVALWSTQGLGGESPRETSQGSFLLLRAIDLFLLLLEYNHLTMLCFFCCTMKWISCVYTHSLECYSRRGHKESDITYQLNNDLPPGPPFYPHPPAHPSGSSQSTQLMYNGFPLTSCLTRGSVHMSGLVSQLSSLPLPRPCP